MLTRVVTAVVGFPLMAYVLISGGRALDIALMFVSWLGVCEFRKATTGRDGAVGQFVATLALYAYFFWFLRGVIIADMPEIVMFVAAVIMAYGVVTVVSRGYSGSAAAAPRGSNEVFYAMLTFAGFLYVALMLGFVILVRQMPGGAYLVWLVFISAWGSDTCAYFVGKALGRHKLCPSLSPSKTIEGAVGGVVGAAVIAMLYGRAVTHFYPGAISVDIVMLGVVVAFSAVMSIFGDLSASAIKRQAGIKDFGRVFPGHGGVLDRFDSVLFAAPTFYILLSFI